MTLQDAERNLLALPLRALVIAFCVLLAAHTVVMFWQTGEVRAMGAAAFKAQCGYEYGQVANYFNTTNPMPGSTPQP